MNEDIKEFIGMMKRISSQANTMRFTICGKSEPVERVKKLIEENEELLYEYEFEYYTTENLSEEYDERVSILPLEMKPLIIRFIDDKTIIEEIKDYE